jgi:hypothetical protein
MSPEELGRLVDATEARGDSAFNLTLPRTSYKRSVRVAEGLYGVRVGHTVTDDTVVAITCTDARKWLARIGRQAGAKMAAELKRTMDRDSEGGNT